MGKISIITGCFLIFFSVPLHAAPLWTNNHVSISSISPKTSAIKPYKNRRVSADLLSIRQALSSSVNKRAKGVAVGIDIPLPDGTTEKFSVEETHIMEQPLADKYPEIKTYKVRGIDTPSSSGRVDVTPRGFHAFIYTEKGLVYIDPVRISEQDGSVDEYASFYKKDYAEANNHLVKHFSCGARPEQNTLSNVEMLQLDDEQPTTRFSAKTTGGLKTYRLAVATTGEYSNAVAAGNVPNTLSEIVTAIGRVNEVFERDLAIRLVLIANTDQLIKTNPSTDGYTNDDLSVLTEENQIEIEKIISEDDYDVGHVLGTAGGGLALLSSVCINNFKAKGATGIPSNLTNDIFYIDFLAHELGHQFGAHHSFNGTTDDCSTARDQVAAFEPGGGNTIMAYTGNICGAESIQALSDDNFHAGSIDEIISYTRLGSGRFCSGSLPSANSSPSVNVGPDIVIPLATPFTLSAISAFDPESDPISYQWQQMDTGAATDATTFGRDLGSNPLFKSFPPVSTDSRTFPQMSTLLASVADPAEVLPTIARTMNFRLLVKDGNGGVDDDNIKVRVTGVAGPFKILQPNTSSALDIAESQVVEWDSSCTDQAPVNCANVDILFSADGGNNFTSLVSSTPNDGDESVIFPQTTTSARLKIMCSDNIFFDVSDVNFTVDNVASGNKLDFTGTGGNNSECVAEPVPRRRGGAISPVFLMSLAFWAMIRVTGRRY